jgi:hypothetical protein
MWIPTNYRSKSASKDREDCVFMYKKKKKGSKSMASEIKGFKEIKKMK